MENADQKSIAIVINNSYYHHPSYSSCHFSHHLRPKMSQEDQDQTSNQQDLKIGTQGMLQIKVENKPNIIKNTSIES